MLNCWRTGHVTRDCCTQGNGVPRSHEQRVPLYAGEYSRNYACTTHKQTHARIVPSLTHKSTNRTVHTDGMLNNCRTLICWIQGHHAQSSWSNMSITYTHITCAHSKINQCYWKRHHILWGSKSVKCSSCITKHRECTLCTCWPPSVCTCSRYSSVAASYS